MPTPNPTTQASSAACLSIFGAQRLAAFQRKFPALGITLLYILAGLELLAFPLLGAGTALESELPEVATVSILELQSLIFASVAGCLVLVLRIIQELWATSGGVFNVDDVLAQMVLGLEEEMALRLDGELVGWSRRSAVTPSWGAGTGLEE